MADVLVTTIEENGKKTTNSHLAGSITPEALSLFRSIAESLDSGFILYNSQLDIYYCSPAAVRTIELCGTIDLSLAAGTDS